MLVDNGLLIESNISIDNELLIKLNKTYLYVLQNITPVSIGEDISDTLLSCAILIAQQINKEKVSELERLAIMGTTMFMVGQVMAKNGDILIR